MAPVTMVTEREKLYLEDALAAECLKEKKYGLYANTAEDKDLQKLFERMAKESTSHREKIEQLMHHTGLSIQPH
ncbi:MAG: ferritin family protein [bacterium]|jgi:rubrerythrin